MKIKHAVACAIFFAVTGNSAVAQCIVDNKKVFIDPRLVPQRPKMDRENLARILASGWIATELKAQAQRDYMAQFEPIIVPYANGRIYISPQDPCLQQFIPN